MDVFPASSGDPEIRLPRRGEKRNGCQRARSSPDVLSGLTGDAVDDENMLKALVEGEGVPKRGRRARGEQGRKGGGGQRRVGRLEKDGASFRSLLLDVGVVDVEIVVVLVAVVGDGHEGRKSERGEEREGRRSSFLHENDPPRGETASLFPTRSRIDPRQHGFLSSYAPSSQEAARDLAKTKGASDLYPCANVLAAEAGRSRRYRCPWVRDKPLSNNFAPCWRIIQACMER